MKRNLNIDLLRGIAVHFAVFNHVGALIPDFSFPSVFLEGTWSGVNLFFVISGYVVSMTLTPAMRNSRDKLQTIKVFF